MYTNNNKVMFSEYCTLEELGYCKKKLKAKLFSTFCKFAKEGEKYSLLYWFSLVPLSNKSRSFQLSISAVIKDTHQDTEDMMRKIIPDMQKSVFSTLSSLFKLNKNHSKFIGDKYMIIKCPHCGRVVPYTAQNELNILKAEIKNKDALIEQMSNDNEILIATIANLKTQMAQPTEPVVETEQAHEELPAEETQIEESIIEQETPVQIEEVNEIPEAAEMIEKINIEETPVESVEQLEEIPGPAIEPTTQPAEEIDHIMEPISETEIAIDMPEETVVIPTISIEVRNTEEEHFIPAEETIAEIHEEVTEPIVEETQIEQPAEAEIIGETAIEAEPVVEPIAEPTEAVVEQPIIKPAVEPAPQPTLAPKPPVVNL